jgi:hypothetical protein
VKAISWESFREISQLYKDLIQNQTKHAL